MKVYPVPTQEWQTHWEWPGCPEMKLCGVGPARSTLIQLPQKKPGSQSNESYRKGKTGCKSTFLQEMHPQAMPKLHNRPSCRCSVRVQGGEMVQQATLVPLGCLFRRLPWRTWAPMVTRSSSEYVLAVLYIFADIQAGTSNSSLCGLPQAQTSSGNSCHTAFLLG